MIEKHRVSTYMDSAVLIRYQYILLGLVVIVAAALRFYKLGTWSLWIDEIFTINRSQNHYDPLSFFQLWTPISVILEAQAFKLWGINEFSSRLVPALIGIITIPILYFPIKRFFGIGVALIASLLLAASPWHLFWSQNARFYTMLLLLFTLACFAYLTAIERNQPVFLIIFFVVFWLAIRERALAIFGLPAVLSYPVLFRLFGYEPPSGLRTRMMLILYSPFAAVLLFELIRYMTTGTLFFGTQIEIFFSRPIDDPFRLSYFIVFNLGIPLVVLGLFGGVFALLKKDRIGSFWLLAALLPTVLLIALSSVGFAKDRYIFMTLPAWIILAAYAIHYVGTRLQHLDRIFALALLLMLLADAAGNHVQYFQTNHGNRRNWRGAFQLVEELWQPDDTIVSTRPEIGEFYLEQDVLWMADVEPETVREAGGRYWFVTDSESVWAMGDIMTWVTQNAHLIDKWTLRLPEDISLSIYRYDPAQPG